MQCQVKNMKHDAYELVAQRKAHRISHKSSLGFMNIQQANDAINVDLTLF